MFKKSNFYLLFVLPLLGFLILTGCTTKQNVNQSQTKTNNKLPTAQAQNNQPQAPAGFSGTKGEKVSVVDGQVVLDKKIFDDGLARFYNVDINAKPVYFFVVKDSTGIYRAAANACQVCYDSKQGFRQQGDFMVCNTCGNKYPLNKIATEKGGCNPGPINPNLEVKGDKVIIEQADIAQVSNFF